MAEQGFFSPLGLYGLLNSVQASLAAGDWRSAECYAVDAADEGRRLMSAHESSNLTDWREFLTDASELLLTLKAHDLEGSHEVLAGARASLSKIVGPETGPAVH